MNTCRHAENAWDSRRGCDLALVESAARALKVRPHGAVHLHHRRRGLLPRQGSRIGGARRAAAGTRLSGAAAQARSLPQRRSGHDVALSARRGVRHRRRRRDRPRPWPLRALHRPAGQPPGQHHHRPHLPGDPRQGAARRLSGRHHPGRPPRHQRDQGVHPRGQRGLRFRAVRDRRHGRRHRGPAVLRGDPPARQRSAAPSRNLHPPHAVAVHHRCRRAQDQADPALGQGAALDRHPARHSAVPLGSSDPEGGAAQARPVLQCARERGDRGARRRQYLRRARGLSRSRARQRSARRLRNRAQRRRPISPAGGSSTSASAIPRATSPSRSSASTRG